jgi:hypothetical protein
MPKLSSKLSPVAKRSFLAESGAVQAMVEVSATGKTEGVLQRLAEAGATESHWISQPSLVGVTIPSAQLSKLADLDEVVYVDLGKMRL